MKRLRTLVSEYWPFTLGLLLSLYYITFEVTGLDLSFYPGDLIDTRFNIYILEHGYRFFLIGDVPTASYWDAPFIYPQESIITFSDNLLGVVPLYALFRIIGFDLITSFQLWFISLTILNFYSAYLFFNWVLKNRYAAVIGAMVFAFSIALFGQMAHPQTFPRFCIPLAFLFACKFHYSFSPKHFFLTVFLVVYQFYCALYLGFMLIIPVSIMLVTSSIIRWRQLAQAFSWKWLAQLSGVLAFNVLILLPLAIPYMTSPALTSNAHGLGYSNYQDIFDTIPLFRSYLFVRTYSYFWWCLNQVGMDLPSWWDHQLFPGATVIISSSFLLLYGIKSILDPTKKINALFVALGITIAGTFLFFTRTDHFSFNQFIHALPGFGSMRSIGRIINIQLLFFGLITAITFSVIVKKSKGQAVFFIIVLICFLSDNFIDSAGYVRENKAASSLRLKHLENELQQIDSEKIVCLETYMNWDDPAQYQVDAMLAAQKYGRKTINGYTSNCPDNYSFCTNLDSTARKNWNQINNIPEEEVAVIYQNFDFELDVLIEKIKRDDNWLEMITKQAKEREIPLEENIRLNATWVLNERLGKN